MNIFNAALVTPTYYVFFTSATIITSAVLFQGFKGSGIEIATIIMGFLQICAGVVLLQLSKSAKDVPDAAVFKGDLDQMREVVTQEEPETEPRADTIRGTASIVRRISAIRRNHEEEEARRFLREKREDSLSVPSENEIIEWDGLRRRKTIVGQGPTMARPRTPGTPVSAKSAYPPLGMTHFPEENEHAEEEWPRIRKSGHPFFEGIRSRASVNLRPLYWWQTEKPDLHGNPLNPVQPVALTDVHGSRSGYPESDVGPSQGRERRGTITWADEAHDQSHSGENSVASEPLPNVARRQFSFHRVFSRNRSGGETAIPQAQPPRGILRRKLPDHMAGRPSTDEERLGLVQGDPQTLDEKDAHDRLERTYSSSSESSYDGTQRLVEARPREPPSVATTSTTSFPRYEEVEYYASADPIHQQELDMLTSRNATAYVSRGRAATTRAPLPTPPPPVQDEDLVGTKGAEPSI